MQYEKIGFRAGLEIHQQLETHKLFCACQSTITGESTVLFERVLRPTQSELGDVDTAALKEAQKRRRFVYSGSPEATCLVEADEEPPHDLNTEAVDVCLMICLMLQAKPVDEIQCMRKIVIDGSNTSGFQRTALVATGGAVRHVGIQMIALEEDAAQKLDENSTRVYYDLDRLGISLIEISTHADIQSPEEAREIALELGMMLQATGKVKKGLGTIRQDLNVSIAGGARIEIKGIQSLRAISRVAEQEVLRQVEILEIRDILQSRVRSKDFDMCSPQNLQGIFKKSTSKLIQKHLKDSGCIKGVRLPGYKGLLKLKDSRVGRDLAVYAQILTGIGGIIHSDEVPGYGIQDNEVNAVKHILQLNEADAFVLVLGVDPQVDRAVEAVVERARMFLNGVPGEVRRSLTDDSTEYMRPLPGAARMYPETDVPPLRITSDMVTRVAKQLPEHPSKKRTRFIQKYQMNEEQIRQLFIHGYEHQFELLIKQFPHQRNTILRTLLNTIPELETQGISAENTDISILSQVFTGLVQGCYAKEAVPTVLTYLLTHPKASVDEAVDFCGLHYLKETEIRRIISTVLQQKASFVRRNGEDAVAPLMGVVMKKLRGKADGKFIHTILKQEVKRMIT